MPLFSYLAKKIVNSNQHVTDDQPDIIEYLMLENDEEVIRSTGNARLLHEHPDLSLDDFYVSISPKQTPLL